MAYRISELTAGTPPYPDDALIELSIPNVGAPSGYDSRKGELSDILADVQPYSAALSLITTASIFASLPAASGHAGEYALVSDIGIGRSIWASDGTLWAPLHPVMLARSAVRVPHTGSIVETVLATVTVPAGVMGTAGSLVIDGLWSCNADAELKTGRIKFGGTTVGTIGSIATTQSFRMITRIANRGSASSQIGTPGTSFGALQATVVTTTVNTAAAASVTIVGLLADATDTIALEAYSVTLHP